MQTIDFPRMSLSDLNLHIKTKKDAESFISSYIQRDKLRRNNLPLNKCVLIAGPRSSGKSSLVYAICTELRKNLKVVYKFQLDDYLKSLPNNDPDFVLIQNIAYSSNPQLRDKIQFIRENTSEESCVFFTTELPISINFLKPFDLQLTTSMPTTEELLVYLKSKLRLHFDLKGMDPDLKTAIHGFTTYSSVNNLAMTVIKEKILNPDTEIKVSDYV